MNKNLLFIFSFLFFFSVGNAQTTEEIPLSEILAKLAVRYDRIFSYADQVVAPEKAEMPPKTLSFQEALNFIEARTNISFKHLGEGYVAVRAGIKDLPLPLTSQLDTVVVTNFLTKGIVKKRNGSVQIDYENFGILPGLIEPDVFLTLQALPGVESVNETVSNINVRGGSNDQNLILWDGIRMYQSGHFFGLISAFNPYQTSKILLIKNGTDPSFGNSVSSVIAMKTDRRISEKFHAAVGVNFLNLGAFLDTPFGENASLQVSARVSLNPFFITPTYEQYYDRAFQGTEVISDSDEAVVTNNQEFYFYDFSLRWLYDLSEKDRVRINLIQISNELGLDENTLVNGELRSKESEVSQNSLGAGFFYRRNWNSNWQTSLQTYFSDYRLQASNVNLLNDRLLFQENNVVETGIKLISELDLNKEFEWTVGYDHISTQISNTQNPDNSEFSEFERTSLRSHAIFSSIEYSSANKRTIFEIGGRLNYFSKLDALRLEPRLSFNQLFLENFQLEILGELKSQAITQLIDFQTDFLGIEKRRWRLANNEDLPILRSKQVSFGLQYNNNGWLASMEGYLKNVEGISSQSQGFRNQYQYAQIIGSYFVQGFDILLNKKIGDFSSWISYSFTDNTYTFPILLEEHFPNSVEIVHAFNLATSYSYRDFKISLGMKWRSGKPFTPLTEESAQSGNLIYQKPNSANLKNYFRVDLSASQEFKLGKNTDAYVGVSVWNLLNTDNTLDSYYQPNNDQLVRINQRALGITPNFTFRVLF